jgi:hypothetical protein
VRRQKVQVSVLDGARDPLLAGRVAVLKAVHGLPCQTTKSRGCRVGDLQECCEFFSVALRDATRVLNGTDEHVPERQRSEARDHDCTLVLETHAPTVDPSEVGVQQVAINVAGDLITQRAVTARARHGDDSGQLDAPA